MLHFLAALLHSIFKVFLTSRKDLIFTLMILKKENQTFKRQTKLHKVQSMLKRRDRLFLLVISILSKRAIDQLTLTKPSTLLDWQRRFIRNYWTYKHKSPGRRPASKRINNLILEMKLENQLWGCHRIADELIKLGIDLNPTTVNRIIQTFRKQGKIQPIGSWSRFLKAHWDSLFGMDFMTIDTLFGKRFYLLIILELKSRRIVQWNLTETPSREFVKQRIALFSEDSPEKKTLIYDNAPQFTSIDYSWYNIQGANTCTSAPNMNAFTERVIGSIRREVFDYFILISEKQIRHIIREYAIYYNCQRPHQSIDGIPEGNISRTSGNIKKELILGGLHHNYYRSSA